MSTGCAPSTFDVNDRASLWKGLANADIPAVEACLCAYSPPPERLIIRSAADFATLGTTMEAVYAACDPSFWAYGDFKSVFDSFSLPIDNKERRVMGVEGVGSPEALADAIASGSQCLKIGHLSLLMMQGKVENGEVRPRRRTPVPSRTSALTLCGGARLPAVALDR